MRARMVEAIPRKARLNITCRLHLGKLGATALPMNVLNALMISRKPATAFVVVGLFWGCFAAFVPVIKAQLGANDALFGTLLLGSATGLLSSMWLAPRADRVFADRSMQLGVVLLALAWLVPHQIETPFLFAVAMGFVGGASGLLDVVMNARVSELEAKTGKPLMNANHAMFSVAYGFAALVTGFSREAGVPPLYVFGCFSFISLALALSIRMPVADVPTPQTQGHYPLWPIVICGFIVLAAFMSEATVEAWSALHIERTLGGGATEGALGPAMLGLTMAVGRFSGQSMSERFSEFAIIYAASSLTAIGALIAAWAGTPMMANVGFALFGLGVSVIGPIGLAVVGKLVPAHLRTEAIARVAVLGFSGFFIAPIVMGLLSESFGLRIAFSAVAALILSAIPLSVLAARMPRA